MINEWTTDIPDKYDDFKYSKSNLNFDSLKTGCKFKPTKVASKNLLNKIYNVLTDPNLKDFSIVRNNLDKLYNFLLPSTVSDLKKYIKSIKINYKLNTLNIIIIGAGPLGLFTALYLDEIYNRNKDSNIKINIILFDNRILREKYKMPYTRLTQFGFDISELNLFIKNISNWTTGRLIDDNRQFDYINILENMLYVVAYNRNIPMYFTKKYEFFDDLKTFAIKNNFHYLFDCSGGNLGANFQEQLKWNKYLLKKDNYEIKLDTDNYFKLFLNNKIFKNYTIVVSLYDKDNKEIPVGNSFGSTNNAKDIELLKKYKNKCLTVNNFIELAKNFTDSNARCLYPNILETSDIIEKNIKYVKIGYFTPISYHKNICATKINNNLTYIALGNALGSSEYGILFGMKTSMVFSKKICELLVESV
jgi:hypothetical protein